MPGGVQPGAALPAYATYKSPYGPKYTIAKHINGWNIQNVSRLGFTLAGFGGVAGVFALFFFTDIPRVRRDVITKIPIIGQFYVKEIPASDNPF